MKYNMKFKGTISVQVKIPGIAKFKLKVKDPEESLDAENVQEFVNSLIQTAKTAYAAGKELPI